ncbi:uncharacterized protein LOC117568599 isoform X1 [Drosophila albomicans]|uniref:Uncharacterized protein LOC117568599 isoform X1 n=1 Tax=Drosophila albomicans TaxID=7291 RepID=A0A6P8X271_DROAB|nr:uncharacterized protein LOC117568599 isoform X1 [Drosophila albomicans]
MDSVPLEKLGSFCKALRDSELRTLALLGCPMKVRKSPHFFQLEVFVCGHIETEVPADARISCKLIFKCPRFYPRDAPDVHIRSKNNFPDHLVSAIFTEFERIRHLYRGSQHIIPMVTSALHMIEREDQKPNRMTMSQEICRP